ncbi:hypothetical protein JQ580_33585 [Bradyrhizobium japonicum]|uniref:hypothetical protein n=1 Tax=Bradyrhizobium japonicum TaxID=375 RepID=UPI001BAB3347|nr:hypothetical protein [Bradyrhizobium japonicum]MBR0995648.1 hypothetical protein [Bradyrhizobium japonicum]
MADKLSPRAVRVVAAAEAAFGKRWQTALAASAGVSQALLAKIAAGDRVVTDEVYRKIAEGLLKQADRLRKSAGRIDEMAGRMLAELD